jgi:hypothetical protein
MCPEWTLLEWLTIWTSFGNCFGLGLAARGKGMKIAGIGQNGECWERRDRD